MLKKTFVLNDRAVDESADLIYQYCIDNGLSKNEALRLRMSADESLYFWYRSAAPDEKLTVSLYKRFRTVHIDLSLSGVPIVPQGTDEQNCDEFSANVLRSIGVIPAYSYKRGQNLLEYRVRKRSTNPIASILLIVFLAFAFGLLGKLIFPAAVLEILLTNVIHPIYDVFFTILGSIAGPMIFLSVTWGIYGIGDTSTFSDIGKGTILYDLCVTFLFSALGLSLLPLFSLTFSQERADLSQVEPIVDMILGIFPETIVEPFSSGNTLQIIFLALVFGIALLFIGARTSSVAKAVSELNLVIQFLMEFISKLVPFVVFLVIPDIIWSGDYQVVRSSWKFFAVLLASFLLITALLLLRAALRLKVSPIVFLRKNIGTFLIALTTASSAAAFGSNIKACEEGFGINKTLTGFGIPLGMVFHKPIAAIYNLILIFYFAGVYEVEFSLSLVIVALLISAILAVATPPIPGGAMASYTLMLTQVGIPMDALALIAAFDILTDFFITAFESFDLGLSLAVIADKRGVLDKNILKENAKQ